MFNNSETLNKYWLFSSVPLHIQPLPANSLVNADCRKEKTDQPSHGDYPGKPPWVLVLGDGNKYWVGIIYWDKIQKKKKIKPGW